MQCNHIDLNIIESDTAGQTDPQLYGIHPCLSSMSNLNMHTTRLHIHDINWFCMVLQNTTCSKH